MIAAFGTIAGQTARLSLRSGGGPLIGLVFFLAVVTIVPFGVGPDLKLLAGSPGLTLIGAIGAALLTALGRGGLLVAVLVLPFTIPVLIFGVSSTAAVLLSGSFLPPFLILIAITLVAMVVATVAGAAALRAGLD